MRSRGWAGGGGGGVRHRPGWVDSRHLAYWPALLLLRPDRKWLETRLQRPRNASVRGLTQLLHRHLGAFGSWLIIHCRGSQYRALGLLEAHHLVQNNQIGKAAAAMSRWLQREARLVPTLIRRNTALYPL